MNRVTCSAHLLTAISGRIVAMDAFQGCYLVATDIRVILIDPQSGESSVCFEVDIRDRIERISAMTVFQDKVLIAIRDRVIVLKDFLSYPLTDVELLRNAIKSELPFDFDPRNPKRTAHRRKDGNW